MNVPIWIRRGSGILLVALFFCSPLAAQKVKTDFDKSADFSHYKKYSWGKNYLITRQRPDDQEKIDKAIVNAINRHLQSKGFVQDEQAPDFFVLYEGGGLSNVETGAQIVVDRPMSATWTYSDSLGASTMDVWASILGQLRILVADAHSKNVVWLAHATKKIRDPREVMKKLDKEMDQVVKKTLQDFPPRR